jgi:hypothetical protein
VAGADGAGAGFWGAAGVALGVAALAAGFLSPPEAPSRGKVSMILRTTGGSMVDDADRTNSPWLFKCASRVLLSTPSSLASS